MHPLRQLTQPSCARARPRQRGQAIVLGVLTLFLLAVVVMITFNVAVATHQKIKIQNHADTQAYSLAVQQARALNYFVYTNRAIASAYVGMANLHAYMSEAAMLAEIKWAARGIMQVIAIQEKAQSFCGKIPCCKFQHCIHAFEANLNAVGLMIDYFTGTQGRRIKKLDAPARRVLQAFNAHITAISLSQTAVRAQTYALLGTANLGNLREENMQGAKDEAKDEAMKVATQNLYMWNRLFYSEKEKKERIMAEVANATRHPFAWNREGAGAQLILFPPPFLQKQIKASLWMGPGGNWMITQSGDMGMMAGGRTGFVTRDFPMSAGGIIYPISQDAPASTANGKTLGSYDTGTLMGQWRHGAFVASLKGMIPLGGGEFFSGDGHKHRAAFIDLFNSPHQGSNHKNPALRMDRFTEFKIAREQPFNQPSVYAAASTDSRVTENGIRGPWEIANDGSGTLTLEVMDGTPGKLTLTNNERTNAVSKAMVYYHRIGDWSDYPNLFNPYWRAKLHPMTLTEAATIVGPVDPDAAMVVGGMGAVGSDIARGANIAR